MSTASVVGVALAGEEREVALAEVEAVRDVVQAGEYRELLDGLAEALNRGDALPDEYLSELDRLLALALQSGRVRAMYGPSGEQAALRAYRKLPGGAELTASAKAVNDALASLQGQPLESVSLTAVGPGAFTLSLAAGGAELSVRLDRQGARLASVGV
ncbi:MAG TPA: hypothetical protein VH572_08910 [Gaiella sp.]|jgi:hypothetical protein